MARECFVYIVTNRPNGVLYVGVTNDIYRRAKEHRRLRGCTFSRKYKLTRLVYFEMWPSPSEAIDREKQLKGGSRATKVRLIEWMNPSWDDLFDRIYDFL